MDIIATVSIVIDIEWIMDAVQSLMGMTPSYASMDVRPGNLSSGNTKMSKITKIVKSLRLIRLIRIIKLYKYAVQSSSELEEAKMREQ